MEEEASQRKEDAAAAEEASRQQHPEAAASHHLQLNWTATAASQEMTPPSQEMNLTPLDSNDSGHPVLKASRRRVPPLKDERKKQS